MKSLRSLILVLAVGGFPACLSAQANPDAFNAGVAQVNGEVHLVASDPAASVADFTLASAEGGRQVKLAFQATRTVMENDEVAVIGDLTLTVLERDAIYSPGEDYAGAAYGETVAHSITRQVVFFAPKEQLAQHNGKGEISATALIGRESFPELLPAIYAANWPPVADEHCQMPSSASEDYAGPSCSGTLVETANPASGPLNVSEDYRGFETPAPKGSKVKIVLNVREGSVATASFFIV